MSNNITSGNNMIYDNRWHKIRKKVFKRDHYQCRVCGDTDALTVHHITPRGEGGTDDLDNLITLCDACHQRVHRIERVVLRNTNCRRYVEEYAL